MADKTIYQLDNVVTQLTADNHLNADDMTLISRRMSPNATDYVTFKMDIRTLSSELWRFQYPKHVQISTDMNIRELAHHETLGELGVDELAYMSEEDLELGDLAHQSTADIRTQTTNTLPLNRIDYQFGDLAGKSEAQLQLSSLAHKDHITDADISSTQKLTLTQSIAGYGALALKDTIVEPDIEGKIDFSRKISGYVGTLDPLYKLLSATSTRLGGMKVGFSADDEGQDYPVELDEDGNAYVHVPWQNTVYSLPTAGDGVKGGIKLGKEQPSREGRNYPVELDSEQKAYVYVPWTDTVRELPIAAESRLGGIKTGFETTGKKYAVSADASGNAYVEVPWASSTGLPIASHDTLGGIKLGYSSSSTKCAVSADAAGNAFVDVIVPKATTTSFGGFKLGYSAASGTKNYAVELNSDGKAYVNVDWKNDNTTYSAGDGIKIDGTTISLKTPLPIASIKYSTAADVAFSRSGEVYSGSAVETSTTWTAANDCICSVRLKLPMDVSSCNYPYARHLKLNGASIFSMDKKGEFTIPLMLKKSDVLTITGACSKSHATEYTISGTYLTRT